MSHGRNEPTEHPVKQNTDRPESSRVLSIRLRMTLWNTAGFAIVLTLFGTLIYGWLRQIHFDQIDRALTRRFQEIVDDTRLPANPERRFSHWVGKPGNPSGIFGIVFDGTGQTVAKSERIPRSLKQDGLLAKLHSPVTTTLPNIGRVRQIVRQLIVADRPYLVVLHAELHHLDEEMAVVLQVLLIAIPITLLVAAGVAYMLARKSLAPVERLRRLTDEITAERLDRRLPIDNPHDELGMLGQTINAMITRLARSFSDVRRFTADASHELRTPVAIIRSDAELGLERVHDLDETRSRFGSILEECDRLGQLTEQLLTLCREDAETSRQSVESVDLGELAEEAAEVMNPLALAKRQTLEVNYKSRSTIEGDPRKLRQVIFNLLDNAIKYTPEAGRIVVTIDCQPSGTMLSVRDTGMGISREHLPFIFDRFYRVDKANSVASQGSGLGLSIVRSIVEGHGGRIELISEPKEGSEFRIWFAG